ncbi:hypothetical protein LIER_22954 [Lithospermum erythrorhizon]|uniref:Uncharacterized protein n=1 Tax=Lithospermum erythrorhizon TaxID=34254 RepID=A0AAV3QZC4_LITER
MVEAVPRIWTLKEEARGLLILSAADIDSVAILRNILSQGENKLLWYAFCDEAILVMAGLVYDKVFNELVNIASSQAPQLVDFNDMLMDRPSLFTRVAITTKTKPRESLVPEAVSSSPLPSGATLPTPSINPLLKRMASDAPPATQHPKKAKKSSVVQKKKGPNLWLVTLRTKDRASVSSVAG